MSQEIVQDAEQRMGKALQVYQRDLATVRAGRASVSMLDKITVEYYGSQMPVTQVATVNSPEPRMLVITPWDKSMLHEIERAIQKSDLGINPNNDGIVIRLAVPALTEQRRQELVKVVHKMSEECRIAVRNIRRDANDALKKQEKAGALSEDELRRSADKIQALTDRFVNEIDKVTETKEADILEV